MTISKLMLLTFAFGVSAANASEAVVPAAVPPVAAASDSPKIVVIAAEPEWKSEKVICKKQEVIGSLIQSKRVCATARIWQAQEASAKENLRVLTEPGAFSPNR